MPQTQAFVSRPVQIVAALTTTHQNGEDGWPCYCSALVLSSFSFPFSHPTLTELHFHHPTSIKINRSRDDRAAHNVSHRKITIYSEKVSQRVVIISQTKYLPSTPTNLTYIRLLFVITTGQRCGNANAIIRLSNLHIIKQIAYNPPKWPNKPDPSIWAL